jgi:hypothetical protein
MLEYAEQILNFSKMVLLADGFWISPMFWAMNLLESLQALVKMLKGLKKETL